jgi:hypothetical protein
MQTIEEQITEKQWDMLNEEQKKIFQDELGKNFSNGNYPNRMDILTFLKNNGISSGGVKALKTMGTPASFKEIDELWEDVLNCFNSK